MKITYSAAASLDGFIAREDGDVSWLDEMNVDPADTGLEEFFAQVDGLVMGRHSYDFVFDYGSWPYEDKPAWVCTSQPLQPMEGANLRIVSKIDDVISQAESHGYSHLWLLGGGKLASSFLNKGLITHLSITQMPIKLGTGIPLFAEHKLENLFPENQKIIEKKGYQQLELEI